MTQEVVSFDEFIDKYQAILCNQPRRIEHVRNGTIDQFYDIIMRDAVVDITLIPTRREMNELDPYDDEDEALLHSFATLIQLVSTVFVKPSNLVKRDLLKRMKLMPVDDLRIAAKLKRTNRLN